jgi:ribosomal protein S27E
MTYDAGAQKLRCDHCGSVQDVPQMGAEGTHIQVYDLASGVRAEQMGGMGRPALAVRCKECGASVQFEQGSTATACAFCGSSYVAPQEVSAKAIRPESLVPFRVDANAARSAFSTWLGKLWFRPSDLKKMADLQQIEGMYVPFWAYNSDVLSAWTAMAGYHYYVTVPKTDSQGKTRMVRERRTNWVPAWGNRQDRYDNVLVCASQGLPDDLVRKVQNFDCNQLAPYNPAYLSGWKAEEYVVDLQQGWGTASKRIADEQFKRCGRDVPGDTHRALSVNNTFRTVTWRHILLPLWIAAYRYKQKVYRFLVNGQTGEVVGKAPWSVVKILALVLVLLAVAGTITFFATR